MIAAKHTPGPWKVCENNVLEITAKSRKGKVEIAQVDIGFVEKFDDEQRANARLIAAAPDLLAALLALDELCDHVPVFQLDGGKSSVKSVRLAGKFMAARDAAKAAIAKVTA